MNVGKLLLSPTRTYAPILKEILKEYRGEIHGIIHCSGGGQTKVLKFIKDLHVIKGELFETPEVFKFIQESGTSWEEMYKVFNMGHRMEIYCPEEIAESIISISRGFDVGAQIVGRCESFEGQKVTVESEHGEFEYVG